MMYELLGDVESERRLTGSILGLMVYVILALIMIYSLLQLTYLVKFIDI